LGIEGRKLCREPQRHCNVCEETNKEGKITGKTALRRSYESLEGSILKRY
jgi:hypothetical protein